MNGFLKNICEGKVDDYSRKYFLRFGKGDYKSRFLVSLVVGTKIKIKGSYEFANDFVFLAKEIGVQNFSGKVLSKEAIPGMEGRKKAGVIAYEITNSSLSEFKNAYYYLVDCETPELKLKIKKALPKPGQDAAKIDDSFCVMEMDLKYLQIVKEAFFWDMPDAKKIKIACDINIASIAMPENEKDPVKIRELAIRKGKIVRRADVDGKEIVKEYNVEV